MKRLIILACLLATPALAQQPPQTLQQELDEWVASVTRIMTTLSNTVAMQAGQVAALQQQVVGLTKERDDLKTKLDAATKPAVVPAEPTKTPAPAQAPAADHALPLLATPTEPTKTPATDFPAPPK